MVLLPYREEGTLSHDSETEEWREEKAKSVCFSFEKDA